MRNTPLQICNETVYPAERLSLALPLPELFSCAPLYMPIKIIHGRQAGPCLLLTAAMHGNELNGTEIINQLLQQKALKRLRGTLIAIPVVNVPGLMNRTRFLPGGLDLDRCFPGSETGTHAERMAHLFVTELYNKADVCIDLQTGVLNHTSLPQLHIDFANGKARHLAKAFNPPVINQTPFHPGMLRTLAKQDNKPYLTYEAGQAMHFDPYAIKLGLKGVMNCLKKLEMLPERPNKKADTLKSSFSRENVWVYASTSGVSYSTLQLGQYVAKGEELCTIRDPFGSDNHETIKSPEEGIIVGIHNVPLVHEGEALFELALFPEVHDTASQLEAFEEVRQDMIDDTAEGKTDNT